MPEPKTHHGLSQSGFCPYRAGHRDSQGQEALRVRQAQEALQTQLAELQGRLTVQQQAWQKRQKILDGGIEHKLSQLDHCLAQADLVICQTGFIGHNAYWRVKDHCKRTGKPCVFLGNPSA